MAEADIRCGKAGVIANYFSIFFSGY